MRIFPIVTVFFLITIQGCSDSGIEQPKHMPPDGDKVTLDPSESYQTMTGIGGALSWFCDRVTSSSQKDEIIDKIVNDLGLDIIRLKNWYYPVNYPANKVPNAMETSWFLPHFDATNELYDLLKAENPNLKILFSSWGPPSALKSNDQLNYGTLKKEGDAFMYDEYATYWEDVLDHITFVPDYLSIQNEPTWVADWETCEWRPIETSEFPGYEIAFDLVAEKISGMSSPPILVGPESANLSFNGFDAFANELTDNPNLGVYGYHPYNFNNSSTVSQFQSTLSTLGNIFNDKPKFMTEFSGMDWMKTARFINSNLRDANASAYIYWTLAWAEDSEDAMIKIFSDGSYELTPYYYLLRHYSKFVNEGYARIKMSSENSSLDQVAFLNPGGDQITLISINPGTENIDIYFEVEGKTITGIDSYQSVENTHFVYESAEPDDELTLVQLSVTTTVIELE